MVRVARHCQAYSTLLHANNGQYVLAVLFKTWLSRVNRSCSAMAAQQTRNHVLGISRTERHLMVGLAGGSNGFPFVPWAWQTHKVQSFSHLTSDVCHIFPPLFPLPLRDTVVQIQPTVTRPETIFQSKINRIATPFVANFPSSHAASTGKEVNRTFWANFSRIALRVMFRVSKANWLRS